MQNRVIVTIDGFEYTVVSEDTADYIKKNAALVDQAIQEVKTGSSLSTLTATVLAALNFSDRWLKAQQSADSLRLQVKDYAAECGRLRNEVARLKKQQDNRSGRGNPNRGPSPQNPQNQNRPNPQNGPSQQARAADQSARPAQDRPEHTESGANEGAKRD